MRSSTRRGFIVVLRNEAVERFGQFIAELGPLPGRPEPDHRVHGQRRQLLARPAGAPDQITDFPNCTCRQRDEIARGEPIKFPIRIDRGGAQRRRGDDIGRRRRHEPAFRQPAPPLLTSRSKVIESAECHSQTKATAA